MSSDSVIDSPFERLTQATDDIAKLNNNGHQYDLPLSQTRFTFPTSGVTVTIRKISAKQSMDFNTALKLSKKYAMPPVPVQIVNTGGEDMRQENIADPDYLAALQARDLKISEAYNQWFISQTIVWDNETRKRVTDYRTKMRDEYGVEYPQADWELLLFHLCVVDVDDFNDFYRAATSLGNPTQQGVSDAKERFQRRVQRP